MRGKQLKLRAQAIQKEQYGLVQVESVLTKLLAKVNESINELKVEELHLKSSLIEYYTANPQDEQPSTSAQAAIRLNTANFFTDNDSFNIQRQSNATIDMDGIENINKQTLALESLLVPLKQKNYNELDEEEEDDDDDDDYVPSENEESENDELKEY